MIETVVFENLGFSKGETRVYLALLELGEATIGAIAKKAQVTPAKTYPILDKLRNKGLLTYGIKGGAKHYQTCNPKQILTYVDEKRKELDEKRNQIEQFLPTLLNKQKQAAEHNVVIYESFSGMKTLYNEAIEILMANKEDFIGFTLGDEYQSPEANLFFSNYDAKRKETGIKIRLIGLETQRSFWRKEYTKTKWKEFRYLPYALPTGVIIFGDRVATLLWKETPTAFVIQSKEVATAYKKFFEDMWKIAKK